MCAIGLWSLALFAIAGGASRGNGNGLDNVRVMRRFDGGQGRVFYLAAGGLGFERRARICDDSDGVRYIKEQIQEDAQERHWFRCPPGSVTEQTHGTLYVYSPCCETVYKCEGKIGRDGATGTLAFSSTSFCSSAKRRWRRRRGWRATYGHVGDGCNARGRRIAKIIARRRIF